LPVGGGGIARAPDRRQGFGALSVDDRGDARRVSGRMWRSITRLSWWIVTPRELSAMRSSPRFVASARIAPMRAGSSAAAGSPVRKWVKRFANAVQTFTSARRSVMRTRGMRL